jgi:hypothetical protein
MAGNAVNRTAAITTTARGNIEFIFMTLSSSFMNSFKADQIKFPAAVKGEDQHLGVVVGALDITATADRDGSRSSQFGVEHPAVNVRHRSPPAKGGTLLMMHPNSEVTG